MENYNKSQHYKESLEVELPGLSDDTRVITLSTGSRIKLILPDAVASLKEHGQVLFIGCGSSTDKAVSCVEAVKSRFKNVNQDTQILYKRVEEYWEPIMNGLNIIQVIREIPSVAILLSTSLNGSAVSKNKPVRRRSFTVSY